MSSTEQFDPFVKSVINGTFAGAPRLAHIQRLETVVQTDGKHASFLKYIDTAQYVQVRESLLLVASSGTEKSWFPGVNLRSTHPKLAEWIVDTAKRGAGLRADQVDVSLGRCGEFFARSNIGYRWHGVSEDFHEEIQEMLAPGGAGWKPEWTPQHALFGINRSFLITVERGLHFAVSRNFHDCYPDLYQELARRLASQDGVGVSARNCLFECCQTD